MAGEALRVGVVTDVGQLEDKSFNQSSNEGAIAAAEQLGGEHDVIVTEEISDYAQNIQTFIDQDFDVIVTVGFLIGTDTTAAALANPDVSFIGVDQGICITPGAEADPNFACEGDPAVLLPNYQGLVYAEDQAGYLAGIVAGSITENNTVSAIGGTNVPAVVRYSRGYESGVKSVTPNATVLYQETSPDPAVGFNDPATGRSIAEQQITQGSDVIFQIAGLTGEGALQAACDAEIYGIGVDVDQTQTLPDLAGCIVTSATKALEESVTAAILRVADGSAEGGNIVNSLTSDPPGVGLAPFYDFEGSLITPEIQTAIDDAMAGMIDGSIVPCNAPGPAAATPDCP